MLLAQLAGCARFVCSLSFGDSYAARSVSLGIPSVDEIAPLGDDVFLVAASRVDAPLAMDLTLVQAGHADLAGSTPPLFPSNTSASAFRSAEGWWFSREGGEGRARSVLFVSGGDTVRPSRVDLKGLRPLAWLPIRGEMPRGVVAAVAEEQPALHLDEVTPAGVKPLAAFPWWQTGLHQTVLESRWSAEALPDGRVAVVAVDGPPADMALTLRITGDEPVEARIPCAAAIDYPLATAADGFGRLAVVGVTRQQSVLAVIVDTAHPESPVCRTISERGEIAAQPAFGSPAIAWAGDRFVAGWIRSDGMVRACELGNLRFPPLVIDVGGDAAVDRPLRRLLVAADDSVTYIWRERGGGFRLRRMPNTLAGYAFADELVALVRRLCS